MKKSGLIIGLVLGLILVSTLVAAQNLPAPPIGTAQIKSFFSALLTPVSAGTEDTVARLLIFLLLTIVLYKPAEKLTSNNSGLAFALAAIVSIIGVRFFTPGDVVGLLLPSASLAVVISVFAPIALLTGFLVTSDLPKFVRLWAYWVFAIGFVVLWWNRWDKLGDLAYIYIAGTLAILVLSLLDGTVRKYAYRAEIEKGRADNLAVVIEVINQERASIQQSLARTSSVKNRRSLMSRLRQLDQNADDLLRSTSA